MNIDYRDNRGTSDSSSHDIKSDCLKEFATILRDLDQVSRRKTTLSWEARERLNDDMVCKAVSEAVLDPSYNALIPVYYQEILKHSEFLKLAESHEVPPEALRIANMFSESMTLTSYLLYSTTFRKICSNSTHERFEHLRRLFLEQRDTVIIFCQARWLHTKNLNCTKDPILNRYYQTNFDRQLPSNILCRDIRELAGTLPVHPHQLVLVPCEDGSTRVRRADVSIGTHVMYNPRDLKIRGKPKNWPADWGWPKNPQSRRKSERSRCFFCDKTLCKCDPSNHDKLQHPLLDVFEYPQIGAGVRSLQNLTRNTQLAEYVGQVKARPEANDDTKYAVGIDANYINSNETHPRVIASLDSEHYGNWTRWINHSCEPNTQFERMFIGGRIRVMAITIKDVAPLEQITVDYGPSYWVSLAEPVLLCGCGSTTCKYATIEQIRESVALQHQQ